MEAGRNTLLVAPRALQHANARLDLKQIARIVDVLIWCPGRRYFTGIGKSGLTAQRMAASLTSIGLPSHCVHGTEWGHGERGGVARGDLITCVSHSGKTVELLELADGLERQMGSSKVIGGRAKQCVTLVALTGNGDSALARRAALTVTCAVPLEAELLGILPSASVLAVHHVFNAVLAACADRLRLTPEQVRIYHPGGSVGRDVQ